MIFPVLVFEKDPRRILALDYKYLVGDIRFLDVAFKNVEVIDSAGKVFKLKRVEKASGINLLESIRRIGLMVKLKPIIDGEIGSITIDQLKDRIFEHVSKHQKHWLVLDTLEGMKSRIYSAGSFEELIRIFR